MPKEINIDFLFRAIDENASITVYLLEDKKEEKDEYKSRFLGYSKKEKVIFIDEVTGEGKSYKPLSKNEKIKVFFQYEDFRFLFSSQVVDKTFYAINERLKVPAYKIKFPEYLEDGDRRQFFRVPAPMDKPIRVKFLLYPQGAENPVVDPEDPEGLPKEFKATAIDISAGGIAIKPDGKETLEIGDLLEMEFKLFPEDKEEIKLKGIIRNRRRYYETEYNVYGIEFIQERSLAYRRAINKIMRYVFERQREMLAK